MANSSNPDKELSEYEELRQRNMADVQSKYNKLLKDLGKGPKAKKPKPDQKEIKLEFYRSYELRKRGKTVNYSENESDFGAKKDQNSNVPKISKSPKLSKLSKILIDKLLQCPKCDKRFNLRFSLGQHLDQNHSGFRHLCKSCLRPFVLQADLAKHLVKCTKSNVSKRLNRSFSHQRQSSHFDR